LKSKIRPTRNPPKADRRNFLEGTKNGKAIDV